VEEKAPLFLILDIGGGSTEIAFGIKWYSKYHSFDMGSVSI